MEKLPKPEEVTKILGVKTSTIYQWTHQGYIPHLKIRNLVRFKENDIERWIEKRHADGRINRKIKAEEIST
jgi:excisionase family DNA binding protein